MTQITLVALRGFPAAGVAPSLRLRARVDYDKASVQLLRIGVVCWAAAAVAPMDVETGSTDGFLVGEVVGVGVADTVRADPFSDPFVGSPANRCLVERVS